MRDHDGSIWDNYFADFVYHTLHLNMFASSFSNEIIQFIFSDLLAMKPFGRFVYLHVYVSYNLVELANVCSLFHLLEEIWKVAAGSRYSKTSSRSTVASDFINVIKKTNVQFGGPVELSRFVILALFSTLVESIGPHDQEVNPSNFLVFIYQLFLLLIFIRLLFSPSRLFLSIGIQRNILKRWYRTYQRVMTSSLKSLLYTTSLPNSEQAKFDAMHITFSLMHAYSKLDENALAKGIKTFTNIFNRYFGYFQENIMVTA